MVPVFARREIPAQVRTEESIIRMRVKIWRLEQRLTRRLRVARVVAQGQADLIVFADAITKISRQCPIVKVIFIFRTVRSEIGAGHRIIEIPKQSAKLRPAAACPKSAALSEQADL